MVEQYIEERRKRKRLKKLVPMDIQVTKEKVRSKGGKGNSYQYTKTGYRPDIDMTARSAWEANVARVYFIHGIEFEFEPKTFRYPIKRGTKGYTPDFYLPATDEWVEIKGWLDDRSRVKLKRFKKYYPDEWVGFTMIISKRSKKAKEFCKSLEVPSVLFYEDFSSTYKSKIQNWEGK